MSPPFLDCDLILEPGCRRRPQPVQRFGMVSYTTDPAGDMEEKLVVPAVKSQTVKNKTTKSHNVAITTSKRKQIIQKSQVAAADNDADKNDAPPKKRAKKALTDGSKASQPISRKSRAPRLVKRAKVDVDKKLELEPIVDNRPLPSEQPQVWSESRQTLCETLPNYRAYKSAAYSRQGLIHGFMFGADGASDRAFMDEEIAITRAGGNCGEDEDGLMVQIKDHHLENSDIQSFLKNKLRKHAFIGIVSNASQQCPTRPPHLYNVMGYFQVTNVWAEKNNGHLCYKLRFEKLDLQSRSWWAKPNAPQPPTNAQRDWSIKALEKTCSSCNINSKQVLQSDWVCLEPSCDKFWQLPSGQTPAAETPYNPDFLRERTCWDYLIPTLGVQRRPIEELMSDTPQFAFSRESWKGIICPQCGRCNSRERWTEWYCETEGCDFVMAAGQPILSARSTLQGHEYEYDGIAIPQNWESDIIEHVSSNVCGNWREITYTISEGNTLHHYLANKWINREPGGPDDMFVALQKGNGCGLARGEMGTASGGKTLTRHFSVNFGMPYKYLVKNQSKSFSEAPEPILNALNRLTYAGRKSVSENEDGNFMDFNELLAVGYFEGSKMGYHDDGEKELGPTIAAMSLGGTAKFSLRMKAFYYRGFTKSRAYDPDQPVLPGAFLEKERKALNAQSKHLSSEAFEKKRAAMYKDKRVPLHAPALLVMHLRHGDIIVMNGHAMQKYYEHTCEPEGPLRFALTCRYVKPELVDQSEHWRGQFDHSLVTTYAGYETQGPISGRKSGVPVDNNPVDDLPVEVETTEVVMGPSELTLNSQVSNEVRERTPLTPVVSSIGTEDLMDPNLSYEDLTPAAVALAEGLTLEAEEEAAADK